MQLTSAIPARISATARWTPFALVVAADWLFYEQPLGWTLGLFLSFALAAVLLDARPDWSDRVTWGLAGLVALFAYALAYQPGPLVATMGTLALLATVLNHQLGWTADPARWTRRMRSFLGAGSFQFVADALRFRANLPQASSAAGRGVLGAIDRWALPVGLSAIFVWLFSLANPLVAGWLGDLARGLERLIEWFPNIDLARVLFWFGSALLVWPLVRTHCVEHPAAEDPAAPSKPTFVPATEFVFRCLLLFNLTFGVQSLLDVFYLWGGAALPEAMSYAEYAHRGAYPLVATALLAALFVLVCFRPGGAAEQDPRTRKLVFAWIAQNILLMGSTAWRLLLYIEAYGLTRLRIATILWIGLVALGFFTICWRIGFARSNRWLLGCNATAALAVLSVSSLVDFDSRIAWHNVRNCREVARSGPLLDLYYLNTLGPESLPALRWYEQRVHSPRSDFQTVVYRLSRELVDDMRNWRGWTLVRHRVRTGLPSGWLDAKIRHGPSRPRSSHRSS